MDSALQLRLAFENQQPLDNYAKLLNDSQLVKKLTSFDNLSLLSAIFNLTGLAEIPFAETLPYTQKLLKRLNQEAATTAGFSFTGRLPDLVPCYNAMLLEAYCRLGMAHSQEAQAALHWIKQYQVFERQTVSTWPHLGVCKFGGCLKATPCYIGIGKTLRALLTYRGFTKEADLAVNELITRGSAYLLEHQLYKRLHADQPISAHITDLMFPQNYALSATDLCYILGKIGQTAHPAAQEFLTLLAAKQTADKGWKIDYLYKYTGYVPFDSRRKSSPWLNNLLPLWLAQN